MHEPLTRQAISVPPEWAPQKAIWTAWPASAEEWDGDLESPRREVAALVRALHPLQPRAPARCGRGGGRIGARGSGGRGRARSRPLRRYLAARHRPDLRADAGRGRRPHIQHQWLGRQVSTSPTTPLSAKRSRVLPARLSAASISCWRAGRIDQDGEGTVLTTRECLLNSNRNGWTEAQGRGSVARGAAACAQDRSGSSAALCNDHTDGHIDNIARFVAPGVVVCQSAGRRRRSQCRYVWRRSRARSRRRPTRAGRTLQVIRIPVPWPRSRDEEGEIVPASHMNFLIGNGVVVVPVYGTPSGATRGRSPAGGLSRPRSRGPALARHISVRRRRIVSTASRSSSRRKGQDASTHRRRHPGRALGHDWRPTSPSVEEPGARGRAERRASDPAVRAVPGHLLSASTGPKHGSRPPIP